MEFKNQDFPTVEEIKQAVQEYVNDQCGGEWPEDEYFDIGTGWRVNVWDDDGQKSITVYRDSFDESGFRVSDLAGGISIEVEFPL